MDDAAGDDFLLAVLNSTPVVDGVPIDEFDDTDKTSAWLASVGGTGTRAELRHLIDVRQALQAIVRGEQPPSALAPALQSVVRVPSVTGSGIIWNVRVPPERALALKAVLAWDALVRRSPGRLRPCANDECRLFLIDRSRAGTARWCSMAACGNRMKVRRHYERARQPHSPTS